VETNFGDGVCSCGLLAQSGANYYSEDKSCLLIAFLPDCLEEYTLFSGCASQRPWPPAGSNSSQMAHFEEYNNAWVPSTGQLYIHSNGDSSWILSS